MAKANEKKPVYKNWWFWVIIVVLLCAIGGGIGGNLSSNNGGSGQETIKTAKIGETTEYGGAKITINSVKRNHSKEYFEPSAGKEYILVSVTIENVSDDKISYNVLTDWKIESSDGDIHGYEALLQTDDGLGSGDIAKGGKKTGTIAFEIPKDDAKLKIHYYPNWLDDKKELIVEL